MKMKILKAVSAASISLLMSGCFFFPAEEELLEPPTVAVEDIAYSTYTAKQKTIEDKVIATGYVVCKTQYNAGFPESGGTIKTIYVTAGQFVEKGDLIGEVGTTGLSTGNHLHFGITVGGIFTDPMALMGTEPQLDFWKVEQE